MRNNIKQLRKKAGLRQEDMADQLQVSRQTIIAIENDKYDPSLELAIKNATRVCAFARSCNLSRGDRAQREILHVNKSFSTTVENVLDKQIRRL